MLKFASAVLLFAATAAAQTASNPPASRVETTVSLGVAAQLTTTRVQTNQESIGTQALDPSAAVLGAIRQSFTPWLGYTANFGYARTTEVNTGPLLGLNASTAFAIPSNVYEASLAYHLQNHITPRLTGFVDIGAGALTFLPVHRGADAKNFVPDQSRALVPSVTFRPLGVASVGVDYHFNRHFALRAEYRGLFYKYADFSNTVGRSLTLTSQPTVSLVYQFGRKH